MPIQGDFVDKDKHDRDIESGADFSKTHQMPLSITDWVLRRDFRFRKCKISGKSIPPLAKAYRREIFWGLSNDNKTDLEVEWMTPESYTFTVLTGNHQ